MAGDHTPQGKLRETERQLDGLDAIVDTANQGLDRSAHLAEWIPTGRWADAIRHLEEAEAAMSQMEVPTLDGSARSVADLFRTQIEVIVHSVENHYRATLLRAGLGQGAQGCPDCYGKGLTNQDDKPGVILPAEDCPTCGGSGNG